MRERLINRRQQGDLGEASAIEWLTSMGLVVWLPLGHSPDVDLIAQSASTLSRIQVKTTTVTQRTPGGEQRWAVSVATSGGNRSWTGVTKYLDPETVDYLFVLTGDGRRWMIPRESIESGRGLTLGGSKYSECEIEPGRPLLDLVYGEGPGFLESTVRAGERRSRRAGPVCKIGGQVLSGFDSHLPHSAPSSVSSQSVRERRLGRSGQAIVRGKRQMTVPYRPFAEAELEIGDRIRFRADGPGRVIMERIGPAAMPRGEEPA
jgi:hypothetical protein